MNGFHAEWIKGQLCVAFNSRFAKAMWRGDAVAARFHMGHHLVRKFKRYRRR